jgi:hypothetical protein
VVASTRFDKLVTPKLCLPLDINNYRIIVFSSQSCKDLAINNTQLVAHFIQRDHIEIMP